MNASALSDAALVARLRADHSPAQCIIDEYYRRCIPLYLDFIGMHWHTGLYRQHDSDVSPRDQERMIAWLADKSAMQPGQCVLDVGCGLGATMNWLAQHRGIRGNGLTPVDAQKAFADALAARNKLSETISFQIGHAASLPYDDSVFDHVMFLESPCHFADRNAFFQEAFRVLKPGGKLCGEDWLVRDDANNTAYAQWIDPICRAWAIPSLGTAREYMDGMHVAGFQEVNNNDLAEISALENGFCVTSEQQQELAAEISACTNPLLQLTLEGLGHLGRAMAAGCFTIGSFHATRPHHH